jgi:hypothetical protein
LSFRADPFDPTPQPSQKARNLYGAICHLNPGRVNSDLKAAKER